MTTREPVRRYRVSPARGLVEDDGGIFPMGVSAPVVLAAAHDKLVGELMRYADHASVCAVRRSFLTNRHGHALPCDCGFEALRKELEEK